MKEIFKQQAVPSARRGEREINMKEVGIEFCDNKEIFYIWDDGEYYMINGSTGYPKRDWLLSDAVKHYKSDDAKCERFESEWNAWCG